MADPTDPDLPPPSPAPSAGEVARVLGALLPATLGPRQALVALQEMPGGRYVHADDGLAALLGCAPGALVGHSDGELFDGSAATALRAAVQTALAQGGVLVSEHRLDRDGQRRELEAVRIAGPAAPDGRRWLCTVWRDLGPERQRDAQLRASLEQIEQLQLANDQLRRQLSDQALRDPASGLYRRAHFDDQLRREVDLSTREHREFAIVMIELDPPGETVRALGEDGTRAVLEAMGRLLRGGTRAMDASCRYDERRFAVLLSGVGLATAHARMEGLRRKCAAQIVVHEGRDLGFTVAMGVASFPHTANTQEALLAACESALAEARRRGGNHVTLAAIRFEPAG
ncbi:MAG: diguanylate cyclase [Rubrivivax sp.]|nr:diguanylate cyclase [Rubrivivax sp.]